jgi:carboxyl-terminal processing protease
MHWLKSTAVSMIVASSAVARTVHATSGASQAIGQRMIAVADTGSRARSLDSTVAVATFDSAWRVVAVSLEGRGVTRLDWPAVRQELRPRAARASSDSALRVVIGDMLSRIGESHFAIIPAETAPADGATAADASTLGTAGLALRLLGTRVVVWRVDSGGSASRAGVRPGWAVERIGDDDFPAIGPGHSTAASQLSQLMGAMRALRGGPGTRVQLVLRDADGVRRDLSFTRDSLRGPVSKFGNLPPLPASVEATRRTLPDGRCVGVIRFEYWLPPVMPALDRAVDSMRNCAGIILDLRGNLGGVAGMTMGAAGHFLSEPQTLGTMRTRGEEMRFVANPRRVTDGGVAVEPFTGDLAILVDGLSASTTEMFAAAMQALGRARVFGERTAGQALPAMATRLPTGDVLMHVVADFVAPDGSRLEGRGVIPDELVPLTRGDLVAERDAPLEAAMRWIERARPSGR